MNHCYKFLAILVIILLFLSCANEDDWSSSVPYARVEIDIQTQIENEFNQPFHSKKYYSGKNKIQYGGYVGVIVISNVDASWLFAYDLCCPNEAPQKNELVMDGTVSVRCPKCNTKYSLISSGRPESGPGTEKLKEYRNIYKNGDFYRIRN